jgi:hypothetical protein
MNLMLANKKLNSKRKSTKERERFDEDAINIGVVIIQFEVVKNRINFNNVLKLFSTRAKIVQQMT